MILFFHNTATEYRIPLFRKVSQKIDVLFIFTRMDVAEKVYATKRDASRLVGIKYKMISRRSISQVFQIWNLIKQTNVSGVVVPTLDSLGELLQAFLIYFIAKKEKKYIFSYLGHWDAPKKTKVFSQKIKDGIRNFFTKKIANDSNVIFVYGIKTKEYLQKLTIDEAKIKIIYNVSEMPEYTIYDDIREKFHIDKEKRSILYFGRIIKLKGLDVLLKAYAELDIDTQMKVHLFICGEGEFEEECKVLADSLDIENITWVGNVHPDRRYEYFIQCDIYVLPSYFYHGKSEAWGLTINEAIQCGKVVIGTTAVGAAYELINENNGRIVKANSVEELRKAIEDLITSNIYELAVQEDYKICQKYNYENSSNLLCDVLKRYDNC